jgi:ribosomal protein S18 acetylase RimI-like enzyme
MPELEIQPFSEEHLDGAAVLLRERHARHVEAEPLLAKEVDFRAEIEALLAREGASGVVVIRDRRPVGYLIGTRRDDDVWGPNVWVEAAGHAVDEPEILRDLYAAVAGAWVDQGRARHYALVPEHDAELVDAWFRVGFGGQHAHGIQEVPPHTDVRMPPGVEIRPPSADEVEELIALDLALPEHQAQAPVFSTRPLPTREDSRKEWLETLAGDEEHILVGYLDGRPVACWAYVPLERSGEHTGLARAQKAAFLSFASTLPEARGSGIGVALTDAGFAWAAEQGYSVMVTDWRETNLLASRFWPRRGFRRTFLRLYRSIP